MDSAQLGGDLFEMSAEDACQLAIDRAGGPTAVARAFTERGTKISPQAVDKWRVVPAPHARLLSELAGGTPNVHQLRPDVFGRAPSQAAA
jgi:hypothetical protein